MPDGHSTAEKNNYRVTFHPAFASRCLVSGDDGECEVYKQEGAHQLNGEKHPVHHTIRLEGGRFERDVTLQVHDPKHAIKQIHLELYGDRPESAVGTGQVYPTAETFTAVNTVVTCPPEC
jgi:hypothetical protein